MSSTRPLRTLVAGGGIAGLEALLALSKLARGRVELTLIEPRDELGLNALGVAEPFGIGTAGRLPVAEIAARAGARLVRDAVSGVDCDARFVRTERGARLHYDALLLAMGARAVAPFKDALTWWPDGDRAGFARLLEEVEGGAVHRVAFVVPARCDWTLPAYELALMTARRLERSGPRGAELMLVTCEGAPLAVFGPRPSAAVAAKLADAGVRFEGATRTIVRSPKRLVLDARPADREFELDGIVSLPRQVGPDLPGVWCDIEGFVPVDEHARVRRTPRVWAAGDVTMRVPRQGGLAARQAVAAAEDIAALAGVPITPRPYRPVLRAALQTGRGRLWMQRDLGDETDPGTVSALPLWSPPGKIAARHLGAVLVERDRGIDAARVAVD
jgi:NADH dehydrogenase FAD-containing subunit